MPTPVPDVAVIGAGPVGCVTALAFAHQGAQVLLLEGQPQAAHRLAGEWLHPPGIAVLQRLGAWPLPGLATYPTGQGFVVFPDDGMAPIVLPYPNSTAGPGCEHSVFVTALRAVVVAHPGICFLPGAQVTCVEGQRLRYTCAESGETTVLVPRIVGASGRAARISKWLDLPDDRTVISSMAGVLLDHVELPCEGFGHLLVGGPGPIFLYRIGPNRVRACLDVPRPYLKPHEGVAYLWSTYSPVLPAALRPAFQHALQTRPVAWAANPLRPRVRYGRDGFALVGDAVGHFHPLTAVGMTLGFMDAECLASVRNFADYRDERRRRSQVPGLLSALLYEVFTRHDDGAMALRHALYRMWRQSPPTRLRTMRLLSSEATGRVDFGRPVLKAMAMAVQRTFRDTMTTGDWRHTAHVLAYCGTWLQRFMAHVVPGPLWPAAPTVPAPADTSNRLSPLPTVGVHGAGALHRAVQSLLAQQQDDGAWEGEVAWCPMLAAQYVLMGFLTAMPLPPERRTAVLHYFAASRLPSGTWGLGAQADPYLFVTTLVYVAARVLGVEKGDPLLVAAGQFIRAQGGAVAIPTWGKFWLAMLNLYDWRGVNPILPEAWCLPRWMPLHPSHFYCHTRMIYLAMAAIYGHKSQAPVTPLITALRAELYPCAYHDIDFRVARRTVRRQEVHTPPGAILRTLYRLSTVYEHWHLSGVRAQVLTELAERLRFELQTTDSACLSPVNGLLSIIALWLQHPADPDVHRAIGRLEAWMWHDPEQGLRLAGALSTTWDTALAIQALEAARPHVEVTDSVRQARDFLAAQQIRATFPAAERFDRRDPRGGFCFARVWHGWPVSDCTAEAILALLEAAPETLSPADAADAVRFMLRCQNHDGGFGSYERRDIRPTLEWINPAEMFGDSMTEHSSVECTAACLAALRVFRRRYPGLLERDITAVLPRAGTWLRRQQQPDGLWPGTWGIHFIYGTLFGIRGLLATGALPHDPAIRQACRQLLRLQKADGGWGEHFRGCLTGHYVEHPESQVIQTAWALLALLEAQDPTWDAIEHGARCLIASQCPQGNWPKQDPAGVFFHTAPLDYTLYRSYFPVWALGLYETRRRARLGVSRAAHWRTREEERP